MEALFLRFVWVSLTCSAVMLPLLLFGRWLRRHVRAKALYVVWLILALRLVVPVELTLPEPAVTVEAPEYQIEVPVQRPSAPAPLPSETAEVEEPQWEFPVLETRIVPVTVVLAVLWLTGVLSIALIQSASYLLARRSLLRAARPAGEETGESVRRTVDRLGLRRAVPVCWSGRISTPMVLGLLRPVLLLPEGREADEVVLCHELTHLKRLDLAYKALLVAACWLHWFNPLVWWMSRAASENLELCCDDDVAAGHDAAFRRKYGELLLSTAEEKSGPTLSSRFGGSKRAMRDRLTNLFAKKKRGRALACLALAAMLLVGGLVACEGRPAMTDEEAVEAFQESVSFDGQELSFTIPEGSRGDWEIYFTASDDAGEEAAYIIQNLNETGWTPGETYRFPLEDVAGLTMNVSLGNGAAGFSMAMSVGSMAPENPTYVNQEYGFSLTLPDGWADQVEIREDDPNMQNVTCMVSFYMRDAGDWDGAGFLVGIYRCTSQEWEETEAAGNPYGLPLLVDTGTYAIYAAGPTDVRYDENDPAEKERYDALAAGIPELLSSLTLTAGAAQPLDQG